MAPMIVSVIWRAIDADIDGLIALGLREILAGKRNSERKRSEAE